VISRTIRFAPFFLALLLVGCGGGSSAAPQESGLTIASAANTPAPPPTTTPSPADLRGFAWPIVGACLPEGDQLMPNAPREYRKGLHEGVDFYAVDNCNKTITRGTPVMAAKDGVVIRSDLDYKDLDNAGLDRILNDPTSDVSFDLFRGRQVWVDHGSGVVTRYCHLSGIAEGIVPGARVKVGQTIAFVGETGTPESVTNPGHEYHLHWELRVGDTFIGKGLPPAEVRRLYKEAFSPN
jgi:murein DD-endopeptidase MepM/ murein hydrolase activator NlpD